MKSLPKLKFSEEQEGQLNTKEKNTKKTSRFAWRIGSFFVLL